MSRWPVAAFVALAVATIAAFFLTQHFKVSTPLLAGLPDPHPARINPVSGGTCLLKNSQGVEQETDFKRMKISFYLVHRDDDVDVYVIDPAGQVVDTLATDRHMGIYKRQAFYWNGKTSHGGYAKAGTYYVKVTFIHQDRSYIISKVGGGYKPVTVETRAAPIRVTSVTADGVKPAIYPTPSGHSVVIHFTRTGRKPPTIRIYRTDVAGRPQLVNSYHAKSFANGFWNGTLSNGKPAPQGTYLVALRSRDHACALQTFPSTIPPAAGTTIGAGVTVTYLAAQPPSLPVQPGSRATVEVDARRHSYQWALRRADSKTIISHGRSSSVSLRVKVPAGGPGLYDLALRYGSHRQVVPIVGGSVSSTGTHKGVLVVMPTLTWQGENPVDDDDDGLPNTLIAGDPVSLDRVYAHGLPAGFSGEAGLISYLRASGRSYSLTTDLELPSNLDGYSGVVLAGTEKWLPASVGSQLSTYVEQGGHVLSLGIGALQRGVTVAGTTASNPGKAQPVDDLLARPRSVRSTGRALIIGDADKLHLFSGAAGTLTGFTRYQAFGPVQAPARLQSSAGVSAASPAVIGYRLGKGDVVDVGLPGFGTKLPHNVAAQALLNNAWAVLTK